MADRPYAGSAEPTSARTCSGAGRIVTVRVRPLSLAERDLAPTGVSLAELMSGRRPPISGEVDLDLRDDAREIVGSGFPGLRGLPRRAVGAALDGYLDLVVQGSGRKVVAVEVKLSPAVEDRDVRHLRWLADRLGEDLPDAVVLTTGRHAYRRRDGIAVVPAAMLGP